MYNFLLEANEAGKQPLDTIGDKFFLGGSVLLRGICTVFAVLCIIWLFLVIVRFFLYDLPRRREEEAAQPQAEAAQSAAPQTAAPAVPAVPAGASEDELIAVITAAIAAATAEQGGGKFRVVSFHRVKK